jgi:hypothetical protein
MKDKEEARFIASALSKRKRKREKKDNEMVEWVKG